MSQDYPKANARLAEVGRHWADGEVSHETWRRERRSILREVCNKRTDVHGEGVLPVMRSAPAGVPDVTSPDLPALKPESSPPVMPTIPAPAAGEAVQDDDVLLLALLLVLVLVGAVAIFYLA